MFSIQSYILYEVYICALFSVITAADAHLMKST